MAREAVVSLTTRIAAIEGSRPAAEPYVVLICICRSGSSATACFPGNPGHNERMTITEYRRAFPPGRIFERWHVLDDAEEQPDRLCPEWAARG